MPEKRRKVLSTILSLVLGIFLAWALQAFVVKPYLIPSESMESSLVPGQRILVNRLSTEPHYGDIMVFSPPFSAAKQTGCKRLASSAELCAAPGVGPSDQPFVKRVAALGGDTVALREGRLIRNGKVVSEPWLTPCPAGYPDCSFDNEITVPKGYVYMIGDNRAASYDSRFWGPVPKEWIIGKALATYWPPSRWGSV